MHGRRSGRETTTSQHKLELPTVRFEIMRLLEIYFTNLGHNTVRGLTGKKVEFPENVLPGNLTGNVIFQVQGCME